MTSAYMQCPHWGFVIEGNIRVKYEDGTEEVVGAGEIYYWPSGHTVVVEEAVKMVEFSPHNQMSQVLRPRRWQAVGERLRCRAQVDSTHPTRLP